MHSYLHLDKFSSLCVKTATKQAGQPVRAAHASAILGLESGPCTLKPSRISFKAARSRSQSQILHLHNVADTTLPWNRIARLDQWPDVKTDKDGTKHIASPRVHCCGFSCTVGTEHDQAVRVLASLQPRRPEHCRPTLPGG